MSIGAAKPTSKDALARARRLLPIEAIDWTGAIVTSDGAYVRALEVTPSSPAGLDEAERDALSHRWAQMLRRLGASRSLQFYLDAHPIPADTFLEARRDAAEQTIAAMPDAAEALTRLGSAHDEAVLEHAAGRAAMRLGAYVIVPHVPARRRGRSLAAHRRALRDSLNAAEDVRIDLDALGLNPRLVDGSDVIRLLHRRLDSDAGPTAGARLELHGELDPAEDAEHAEHAARMLHERIAASEVDTSDRRHIVFDGDVEHVIYLDAVPGAISFGWLLHAIAADDPLLLSIHVHGTDSHDRCAMSIYRPLRETGEHANAGRLAMMVDATTRQLVAAGARVHRGDFAQEDLWTSTLPLGRDVASRTREHETRHVADTVAIIDVWSATSGGIAFAVAEPAGTIACIDASRGGMLLVSGGTAAERAVAADLVLIRLLAHGSRALVLDETGRHTALPESERMSIGSGGDRLEREPLEAAMTTTWAADGRPPVVLLDPCDPLLESRASSEWLAGLMRQSRRRVMLVIAVVEEPAALAQLASLHGSTMQLVLQPQRARGDELLARWVDELGRRSTVRLRMGPTERALAGGEDGPADR